MRMERQLESLPPNGTDNEAESHALDFQSAVEEYYRPLYQFALSLTRSESEACDLTQQVFHTWSTKGHQLRDRTKLKSWLFTTIHRAFLQQQRRAHKFPHLELESVDAELPTVHPLEHSGLDRALVLDALARIDETFRAPISLFYLEDYRYKDIAEMLELPLGTVKSRIARGIGHLQRILEPAPCARCVAA
jgi:RNA polymerase sigma factor (sigma-70 family)